MSSVDDYVQRLRKLAEDLMPNITQGKRPLLTRLNTLTQQPLLNGPIMTALKNGRQTGPLRQALGKPIFSNVTGNIGSRIQGIANSVTSEAPIVNKETLELRNANNVPPEIPQQKKKNDKKLQVI